MRCRPIRRKVAEHVIPGVGDLRSGRAGGQQQDALFLTDRRDAECDRGRDRANHQLDSFDVDQLLDRGGPFLGRAAVVAVDELDRCALESAGGVDLVEREVHASLDLLAVGGDVPALRDDGADLDVTRGTTDHRSQEKCDGERPETALEAHGTDPPYAGILC